MADYQELYLELMRATEQAIRTLIEAQRRYEELYLNSDDTPLSVLNEQSKSHT